MFSKGPLYEGRKITPLVCYHAPFPARVVWQHVMHHKLDVCYVDVRRLHPDRADPVVFSSSCIIHYSFAFGSRLLDQHWFVFVDVIVTVQSGSKIVFSAWTD